MCLTENSACGGAAGCETKFATFLLLTHKSWNSSLFLIFKEERVYFDLQFWGGWYHLSWQGIHGSMQAGQWGRSGS